MPEVKAATLRSTDLPPWLDTPAVRGAFDRIGVPVEYAAPNFNLYFHAVDGIESTFGKNQSNKERVGAGGTTAKGRYQITDGTYETMLNRAIRTYKMVDAEPPKWILDAKADPNRDPRDLTNDQSKELILLDMEQRPQKAEDGVGSSALMADLAMGDWDAGKRLFYEHHHTNPDADTIDRAEEFFGMFAPEVTIVLEESGREPAASALARQTEREYATPDLSTRIHSGMLSEITDLPSRVPEEALARVSVPERDRVPAEALGPIKPTQRGQVPIPQPRQAEPAPTPPLRPESDPRIESELAATQMGAMRGDPTAPELPQLEEVVPTQRGQVPLPTEPSDGFVRGQQLGRLEVQQPPDVTARVPAQDVGSSDFFEKPLPPELSEIDLSTPLSEEDLTYERTEPPAVVEDKKAERRSRMPKPLTEEERKAERRARMPEVTEVSADPDSRTGDERQFDRSRDTILTGATLGAYDEVAGFLNQAFAGTPYDETVSQIRKNVAEQRLMNPTTAFFQEAIPGLITGGGIAGQLVKRGVGLATAGGAEGVFTGAMYGETPMERIGQAVLLGTAGATIGGAIGWATRPSSKATSSTLDGGRTAVDNLDDDELLTITIDQAIKTGTTVKYRTNKGALKTVSVEKILDNGNVQIKDGSNVYAVPKAKIERVNVGKTAEGSMREAEEIGQFIDVSKPFASRSAKQDKQYDVYKQDDYLYALDAEQQMKLMDDDYLTDIPIDSKAKRFSYIDERPYAKGRKADYQETDWRNAQTAGEFFDGIRDLIKRFYNDKLVGASDYIMKLSPDVGARFQRFSETALRNNTLAFGNFIEPMEKMIKGMDADDKMLKALIMDYTNTANLLRSKNMNVSLREIAEAAEFNRQLVLKHVTENYGAKEASAFARYLEWNRGMKGVHAKYINGERVHQNSPVVHIHTQLTPEKKATKFNKTNREFRDDFEVYDDGAKEFRSRPSIVGDLNQGGTLVDDYLNPILTDFRRTANYENLNQMARIMSLPETVVEQQPVKMFDTLRRTLIERGVSEQDATTMTKVIKDDFVGQSRSPANWIQFLNSWGYAGSLAGPKSAVLNLHDIPMAAVLYGPGSFKGVFKKMGYSVEDKGIKQNVGEFMNYMQEQLNSGPASLSKQLADTSRKGTDLLMKGSGFAKMDEIGKNAITRMIIQDAVDNVDRLRSKWGWYFSESELQLIEKQIRKHGTNVGDMTGKGAKLFEELFFAGLGQQQLISSAGRPAAWARNPNFRPLWALRGFAIKQLALAQRNIFDNIAKGNKQAAWEYMQRYALFSAGGFGLMNESRQWLWGDGNFTAGGVVMGFADQIVSTASINTIGLNDYQWGKMMEDGIIITWLRSLVPVGVDIPLDTLGDVSDAIDSPDKGWQTPITEFPIINQWSNFSNNMEDRLGIIPQPMDQFSRQFIQQEKPDG